MKNLLVVVCCFTALSCARSHVIDPAFEPHYQSPLPYVAVLSDVSYDLKMVREDTRPFLASFNRELQRDYAKANFFEKLELERDVSADAKPRKAYLLRYRIVDIFSSFDMRFSGTSGKDHTNLVMELKVYDVTDAPLLKRNVKLASETEDTNLYDTTELKPIVKASFPVQTDGYVSSRDNGSDRAMYVREVAMDLAHQTMRNSVQDLYKAITRAK